MSNIKCSHCSLDFPKNVMINENENLFFCCKGCQGVYHLLQDDGLDSFYDKKADNKLSPPIAQDKDSQNFDAISFKQRYIKTTSDDFSSVDLIIEGIHCAACIWLNEKVLDKTDGVVEASINFTNNKAKIMWDDDIVKLSQIIEKIRSIGYNAYPYNSAKNEHTAKENNRDYFLRMSIAIFASMNIMMIEVGKYSGMFSSVEQSTLEVIHVAEFIFSTPVLFYSGWVFFKGAYFGLKNKIVNMDFLVSSGAVLTYIYSLYVLFGGKGESYFDSVTMIITFVLVGKYLEVVGKKSALDTMDTIKANIPLEATVIKNNVKKVVLLDEIEIGDVIEVKSGEQACVDGKVLSGESTFDESSISGESKPVLKKNNDNIYSGTINQQNTIRYTALKNYANSTLNNIVTLLEDSLNSKPKIQNTANEMSKHFSLTILLLAVLAFIFWYYFTSSFETSLIVAISVIVIACPCALALATPIASLVGISWLSKEGLLFKEASFIETIAKANTIVLDKTGTLTKGELSVLNANEFDLKSDEINVLYSLCDTSTHPISKSIKKFLEKRYDNLELITIDNIEQIPALGLKAKYNNSTIYGGNDKLIDFIPSTLKHDINTSIFNFAIDDRLLFTFLLEDTLKEHAKETIEYFNSEGIEVIICSGDNENVVKKIAKELNISNYKAQMSPINKADFISELKKEDNIVVMAGDGINDTLALSRADLSIAMGKGADIAIAVSDIVVLSDSLLGLQKSFMISKRTFSFIKQNLFISLVYNVITIPIALAGYIVPLVAALSMSLSSLLVVGNSMRIKNKKD